MTTFLEAFHLSSKIYKTDFFSKPVKNSKILGPGVILYNHKPVQYFYTFCFSLQENRVPISFSSAQLGSPAAQSVGNGLRHDRTPTSPPRLHSLGKVSQLVSEERTPTPLEKEDHRHCDIRAQIAKIEQFLSSEGFRPQKRRRIEKSEVSKP